MLFSKFNDSDFLQYSIIFEIIFSVYSSYSKIFLKNASFYLFEKIVFFNYFFSAKVTIFFWCKNYKENKIFASVEFNDFNWSWRDWQIYLKF